MAIHRNHKHNRTHTDEIIKQIEDMVKQKKGRMDMVRILGMPYKTINNLIYEYDLASKPGKQYKAAKFKGWDFSPHNLSVRD